MTQAERRDDRFPTAIAVELAEARWLDEVVNGATTKAIARREGLSLRRVQLGIARARRLAQASQKAEAPPRLIPLFPIGSFTPGSSCPHHGEIRPGSTLCCMICHRSGIDDHPGLARDPRTDPDPEPRRARLAPPQAALAAPASNANAAATTNPAAHRTDPSDPTASGETRRQRRSRLFPNPRRTTATTL